MADIRERLLCSEYLSNGTLKDYISGMKDKLDGTNTYVEECLYLRLKLLSLLHNMAQEAKL